MALQDPGFGDPESRYAFQSQMLEGYLTAMPNCVQYTFGKAPYTRQTQR